ncbi:MAG: hypothetical protein NTY48_07165 [Candidatus Diapherotrites archaeon]|nr:hypothetical protein [Candidatus Diapherotrites archaeon]
MFFRRRAVLVGLTLLLIITLFFSTVFASNFIDTSYSDFGLGSSYHTVVNPDGNVVLQSPDAVNYFSTGDFNSKIFDAGGSSQWNKFTFNPQIKYGALPNNACSSQATNDINMCGNVLMLHMDNITQNPNIVAGKVGNALNFDGNNDYVNIGNIGNVKTISYWVKSNSNGNGGIELNSNQYIDDSAIPEGLVNPVVYIDGVQTTLWGSEILTNGGEEAPYSSGIATGWSADGAGVTPTQETTIVHGGSSSQKIITTQQYTGLYQSLSLTNGTTYLVSGWAYISSGTPYVLVQQMGGAWPSYGNTALPSISSQWQYFRFYASSASYASPGLRENCLGATTWYIDDVSIKPVLIRYPVSDTSWHHVVITTSTSVIASAVKIGKGGSTYFNGSIDNIRTWGRELSAVEANSLYQSERNGIVQPDMNRTNLIGEWLFDENATSSWGIRTPDTRTQT